MSTLEKTINLISKLPEKQIENIYSYAQFVSSTSEIVKNRPDVNLDEIFENIVGIIPDSGMSLENYREERLKNRYGLAD